MEIKILQVFLGADGLPYKDQERTVHFPIVGSGFQGASNTTKIRFYYDELVEQDDTETSWVACAKLPNGKIGSKVLETDYDSTLGEHYALLELDSFYFQYKGDVYISLQGYQGGVQVDYDEETELYTIYGTPTIAATGSIKLSVNYATQFVGSGETSNVNFQRILADLGTKLGIRATSVFVEELPTVGNPDTFYVIHNDLGDPNKANIYIWNSVTEHYIWVGDNTLDLGNYYTQEQGGQFEEEIENRVSSVENELSSVASGSPKGVYATLSDLETAYPTGADGIYVVSGTGHWYYWSGSAWTDGGTYQATEISNNSIDETKLTNVVQEKINNTYNELFDIEENKTYELLTSDDYTLLTISGSLRVQSNVINNNGYFTNAVDVIVVDVSEGEEYLISGVANNNWFSFLVALSDDNEIYSNSHNPSYFNDGSYDRFGGITTTGNAVVNQYKIRIPAGVKKMYVESVNANGTQNFDFAKVFKVITSTDDSSVQENEASIEKIDESLVYPYKEVVENTYDNNHTMYGYNSTTGHIFIDYNATPTGNYQCLVKFDVNEGEQFYISAYVLDANSIMLTDNHLDLSLLTVGGYEINAQKVSYTGTNTNVNVNVTVPKGMSHIYIKTLNQTKTSVLCRKVVYKQIKKTIPVITFCRDQVIDDQYGEILFNNGFNATYADPANKTLAKKLASFGSDFGVYTTQLSSTATKAEAKAVIDTQIANFKSMGIYPPFTSMLCNGHRAKEYSQDLAKEYGFRIIRANYKADASGNPDEYFSVIGNNPDFMFDCVYSMDIAENTAQVINAYIDEWIANPLYNKMHLCLFCHTIADAEEPTWHMTVAKFTAVVEHVKQLVDNGRCIVLNYRDYFKYYHPIEAFTDLNTKLLNSTTDLKE